MGLWGITRVRWVFRLTQNYSWQSPYAFAHDWAFQDKKGHTRLIISASGQFTVTAGYAWDGCTPKFSLLDLVLVGTPDGVLDARSGLPKTYHASLIHDVLYQFLPASLPLDRKQADLCFLELMTDTGFMLRHLYYRVVRTFGGFTLPITRFIRKTHGGRRLDLEDLASDFETDPTRGAPGDPL
jgi:hypothetical protein